jgi:hypothetical protein
MGKINRSPTITIREHSRGSLLTFMNFYKILPTPFPPIRAN